MGRQKNWKSRKKNPRKKNQETTVPILHKKKNQLETRVPWADLPQEILGIILGKLLSTVDVIRFGAVCKSWHIDDIPKDHRNLPWLCNFSWSKKKPFLECEMYDPYSRQLLVTRKLVESRRYTRTCSKEILCLGSNQGWLIAAYRNKNYLKWAIFMYNPYTKHFISLPFIKWNYYPCFATFSGNPVSSNDCRVFLSMAAVFRGNYGDYIASYGLNGDKEWEKEPFDVGVNDDDRFYNRWWCCGMQYMNEQIFCLFRNGRMIIRYNLADKSWSIINLGEGSHQLAMDNQQLWLAQGEGDILVACELDRTYQCLTFYFDWPSMSWVGSLQEGSVVFISGDIATCVRPFEDYDDVENNKGCKVYFFDEEGCEKEPSYYAFAEMRKRRKPCFSTVFMEPPRINWS